MNRNNPFPRFENLIRQRPKAWAVLHGDERNSALYGSVRFYETAYGVLVVTEVRGLPDTDALCESPIFAFHIHEGDSCTGNATDPFSNVRMHYNPYGCPHPYHAGDLPPLFGANGYAFSTFLTTRFTVGEIIGKTVIIHGSPDDFVTQPSGNAGMKIACGEIVGRNRT